MTDRRNIKKAEIPPENYWCIKRKKDYFNLP